MVALVLADHCNWRYNRRSASAGICDMDLVAHYSDSEFGNGRTPLARCRFLAVVAAPAAHWYWRSDFDYPLDFPEEIKPNE